MTAPTTPPRGRLPLWLHGLLVFVVVALAFAVTTRFEFVSYDDPEFITENPYVATGLSLRNLEWAWNPAGDVKLWNPLSYLSHQLDVALFGLDPGWHHAMNVLWHALAAMLLFWLIWRWMGSLGWAWWIALLWALHPEKVQSVAWVSERKDVLSGALCFASALLFASWWTRQGRAPGRYLASLALYVAAALAKPSVLPLPLVLVVWFSFEPGSWRATLARGLRAVVPFLAVGAVLAGAVLYFQSQGSLQPRTASDPPVVWAGKVAMSFVFYPLRFLWPVPARLFFSPPDSLIVVGAAVAGLWAILAGSWWLARRSRIALVGGLTYVLLWLPISGLVPISYFFVADRYSYLPQLGLILVLVGLARTVAPRVPASVRRPGLIAVVLTSGVLLQLQLPVWQDSRSLFSHELAVNPTSSMAAIHYGEMFRKSDPEKALRYYRQAHEHAPGESLPLTQMGRMQLKLGRKDDAYESFLQASRAANPVSMAWIQLLVLQVERKEYAEAQETAATAVKLFPRDWAVMMNVGQFHLAVRQDPGTALSFFQKARALVPGRKDSIRACLACHRALDQPAEAAELEHLLDES